MDCYYNPEAFGLEIIGGLDEDNLSYEYNMLKVWRRKEDGALFWATDSGCSCPSPFEWATDGVSDLTALERHGDSWRAFTEAVNGFPATQTERAELLKIVEESQP